jgi:hypothetical protein
MLIIVAQDALRGPMQPHARILGELKHDELGRLLWLITNSSQTDDQELIELEIYEVRDQLRLRGLPSDNIQFACDSIEAPIPSSGYVLKGWDAIRTYVATRIH